MLQVSNVIVALISSIYFYCYNLPMPKENAQQKVVSDYVI